MNIALIKDYIIQEIRNVLDLLSKREKEVYSMRSGLYGIPVINKDICKKLGISEPTCINSWKNSIFKVQGGIVNHLG